MQGKDTTKTTFDQLFEPVFSKTFSKLLQQLEVDKYVKKLTAAKFIILMVYAQLGQLKSLREISDSLYNQDLSRAVKLNSISFSQLSRKLQNMVLQTVQSFLKTWSSRSG